MIKYLGSKRLLLPLITEVVSSLPGVARVVDLFSGTSRVGHALKAAGFAVTANDHNAYAATLARCYVEADAEDWAAPAAQLIAELNALPGAPGWFTQTYCEQARYFQPQNGARIDAIRAAIAHKALPPPLEAILLVSLMEAADRVDSTTGVQMAYLKQWAPRAHKPLELRLPALLPRAAQGPGHANEQDAVAFAATAQADLVYLDPPYNQHKYLGNYHIWESLVRWDQPAVYGVANKRVDCKARSSRFNSRKELGPALAEIIDVIDARYLLVSFSSEGFLTKEEITALLGRRGPVTVIERDFRRYVGARIGIYNPAGEKVGQISHTENKEYLFLVEGPPVSARPG